MFMVFDIDVVFGSLRKLLSLVITVENTLGSLRLLTEDTEE